MLTPPPTTHPVCHTTTYTHTKTTGDTAWMLVSTALVLLMTPGVAFFYGGMAQHKNVVSTIMQAFVPLAIIPILWSIIGFGLAFGPSPPGSAGIIGNPAGLGGLMFGVGAAPNADLAATIPLSVYWCFQLVFAVLTPSLLIGSIADRVNPSALCIFISLWHLVVYCPLAHMVWHPTGLIRVWGVLDFAGGTVVHMSSGYAALVAAVYLGRTLKIPAHDDNGLFSAISEPANVPIVMLGTALLWFGWCVRRTLDPQPAALCVRPRCGKRCLKLGVDPGPWSAWPQKPVC